MTPTRSRRHVLVVSNDEVGESMAGPAIRAYEISRELAKHHDTCVRTPTRLLKISPDGYEEIGDGRLRPAVAASDVVIANTISARLVTSARSAGARIIVDAYDPVLFEALEADQGMSDSCRAHRIAVQLWQLRLAARVGDGFVCASDRQRDLLMGALAAMGRIGAAAYDDDPTLLSLIDIVPFGLPSHDPQRTGPGMREMFGLSDDDFVLVWGGGIWDWFDPITLVRAIAVLAERRSDIKLVFLGVAHPRPDFPRHRRVDETIEVSQELGILNKSVFINPDWVPYEQRANYLLDADVGVSANHIHLESRYAFRTRVLDYLWCGLPIICTSGDATADVVEREHLGRTVRANTVDDIVDAISALADDRELRESVRANVQRVRESYAWSEVAQPLVRMINQVCEKPVVEHPLVIRRLLFHARYAAMRVALASGGVREVARRIVRHR